MTIEQAIDLLDNLIGFIEDSQGSDYDQALKMAIKVLEETQNIHDKCMRCVEFSMFKPLPELGHWSRKRGKGMTREEAISMLRGMKADNLNLNDLYTRDKYEALVMAIKALEEKTGAIEFLKAWRDFCKNNKCGTCPIYKNCMHTSENFTDKDITELVRSVMAQSRKAESEESNGTL